MDRILSLCEVLFSGVMIVMAIGLYRTVRQSRRRVSSWIDDIATKTGECEIPAVRR